MAITLVQSKQANGNSGSAASLTLTSATTAGNLLVLLVDAEKNPGNVTFTPPAGWTQANTTLNQNVFIGISGAQYYYANNPGALTTISVTFSLAVSAWHLEVLEFSGVATASPLDVSAFQAQQATTTPTSGSVITTAAGDLAVGWMLEDDVNGAYTLTQPGGWTALTRNQDAGAWASQYSAWQVQAAAGAIQYNPTLSSTQTDSLVGIMTFKAAGGGGGTVNGSGSLIANSAIAEAAQLVNPSAPVQANAALVETSARLTNTSAPVQANSVLAEAAQVVNPSAPVVAQSLLQAPSACITNANAPVQSNSTLVETAAQIVVTSAPLVSNSVLKATAQGAPAGPVPTARSIALAATIIARSVTNASGVVTAKSATLAASPTARSIVT